MSNNKRIRDTFSTCIQFLIVGRSGSVAHFLPLFLIGIVLVFALGNYSQFPVYPDEVAFKLISARWFQEGANPLGLFGFCRPEGTVVPALLQPAAVITSAFAISVEQLFAGRWLSIFLVGGLLSFALHDLWRSLNAKWLAFLPLSVCCFGLIPAYLLINRPEQLWISTCLLMMLCLQSSSRKRGMAFFALATGCWYVGLYIHPEFFLLFPALILLSWGLLESSIARGIFVTCTTLLLIVSSNYYRTSFSLCGSMPEFSQYVLAISRPAWSLNRQFPIDAVRNIAFTNQSPLHILPSLSIPKPMVLLQAVLVLGLISLMLIGAIYLSWSILAGMYHSKGIARQSFPWRRLSCLAVLISSLLLFCLDSSHSFYRLSAAVVVGSFFLAKDMDRILSENSSFYANRSMQVVVLFFSLNGLGSIVYSGLYIAPIFRHGYVGPGVSLSQWESVGRVSTDLFPDDADHRFGPVIMDDLTYGLVHNRFKKLIPITYMELARLKDGRNASVDGLFDSIVKKRLAVVRCSPVLLLAGRDDVIRLDLGRQIPSICIYPPPRSMDLLN